MGKLRPGVPGGGGETEARRPSWSRETETRSPPGWGIEEDHPQIPPPPWLVRWLLQGCFHPPTPPLTLAVRALSFPKSDISVANSSSSSASSPSMMAQLSGEVASLSRAAASITNLEYLYSNLGMQTVPSPPATVLTSPRVPTSRRQLLTFESFSRNKRRARPARRPRTSRWKFPLLAKNPRCGTPGSPAAAGRPRRGTAGAPATHRWFSGGEERGFRGHRSRSPARGTGRYLNAADTGADDGALVGTGAAGTSLGRHPQEMEGAAVAGALRAFAGEGQKRRGLT